MTADSAACAVDVIASDCIYVYVLMYSTRVGNDVLDGDGAVCPSRADGWQARCTKSSQPELLLNADPDSSPAPSDQ